MRFTTAWATVTSQNVSLRLVIIVLIGLLALMSVVAAKVALRDPLIVERSCYSSVLETKSTAHTAVEIEAFVKEALRERFDSDATPNAEYMSVEEFKQRAKEQDELGRRQMRQRVLVNAVTKNGDVISVDTDRLISVGSIRSAFPFPLTLNVSSVSRSQANPYGLVLVKITPVTQGGPNDKK
jgi:hypothetical protein